MEREMQWPTGKSLSRQQKGGKAATGTVTDFHLKHPAQPLIPCGGNRSSERGLRPSNQFVAKLILEFESLHLPALSLMPIPLP